MLFSAIYIKCFKLSIMKLVNVLYFSSRTTVQLFLFVVLQLSYFWGNFPPFTLNMGSDIKSLFPMKIAKHVETLLNDGKVGICAGTLRLLEYSSR